MKNLLTIGTALFTIHSCAVQFQIAEITIPDENNQFTPLVTRQMMQNKLHLATHVYPIRVLKNVKLITGFVQIYPAFIQGSNQVFNKVDITSLKANIPITLHYTIEGLAETPENKFTPCPMMITDKTDLGMYFMSMCQTYSNGNEHIITLASIHNSLLQLADITVRSLHTGEQFSLYNNAIFMLEENKDTYEIHFDLPN